MSLWRGLILQLNRRWWQQQYQRTHLVNVLRHGVRPLGLGQPGLDYVDPLCGEVLKREDVRPEADPVLVCQSLLQRAAEVLGEMSESPPGLSSFLRFGGREQAFRVFSRLERITKPPKTKRFRGLNASKSHHRRPYAQVSYSSCLLRFFLGEGIR